MKNCVLQLAVVIIYKNSAPDKVSV